MTRRGQGGAAGHAGRSRRLGPLAVAGTLGVLAITLSGCSYTWQDVVGFGWPKGITPEAQANYKLWIGMVIASVVIGSMVWGMIFWASAFHRKKPTDTELPRQFGYNMPLEMVLTVMPFLAIAVVFYFTVVVQEKMIHLDPNPEVVVDVTAFQWNWKFGYQKVDFHDGTYTYDGADPARKQAMVSKPEGVDKHGEELVGPLH
ncbi:MAG TPA: cytochrome C oxidase subunit II, partial [Mycobacterium sp.]|nr:cytochrome C oxidase subunit II [Mycobacterium sp.]